MKKDLNKGLDLLADAMLNPTFPQDEVTKLLKQRLDGVRAAKDRAQGVIGSYFTDKNRTVATLTPENPEEGKKAAGSGQ